MADGNKVYYAMQDMTTGICNQVGLYGEASQTQLVDIRDNNTYWVAKLEDGHCWMTQNLGFDIVADEQDLTKMKALTSEDTDLTDHSLAGAYADGYNYDTNTGIITWTSERGTTDFQNTTVTGWQDSNTEPYSANKRDDANTGHASLGNYYNWTIAIASNYLINLRVILVLLMNLRDYIVYTVTLRLLRYIIYTQVSFGTLRLILWGQGLCIHLAL